MIEVLQGDCRNVLEMMPSASVHAVVTDPPYGLSFMGKKWDCDVPGVEVWRECLRVLKPGGHLLSFFGTRTYHRGAVPIEDAGFEIRDQIGWLYGSGFPKSSNQAGEWQGWGTALKPAWEPIVVARKPLDGTVPENLARHGVGALNVDGCRVPFASEADEAESKLRNRHADFGSGPMTNRVFGKFSKDRDNYDPTGRWPANVIHDGSAETLEAFEAYGDSRSGSAARFFYCAKASRSDRNDGLADFAKKPLLWSTGTQNPGSFQSPGTEKAAQNPHPTVKPTDLMRYLCRLVTPPGGTVLDPFAGSGSTGRGAALEGLSFIGIEREAEYVAIARARIAAASVLTNDKPVQEDIFA
ncbi:DNA-methyltransferase [Aminobacter sp. BE322]|uniref:DNA-methyltransferase n=1 Tax=unclassified Aminobacter TaxID=2644704 RepID=UPI003D238C64